MVIVVVLIYYVGNFLVRMVKGSSNDDTSKGKKVKRKDEAPISKDIKHQDTFSIPDIPDGYIAFEDDSYYVAGVTFRMKACIEWATGSDLSIYFKREPKNKHDTNAIAVYGKSSNGRRKLGYVQAEIASEIVYRELDSDMKARLLGVEIKEAPFIHYEILVDAEKYKETED